MYILLTKCIRAYYVRKYDVSHRGKWCDERVHIYFSHIIPTRKARVIYESCSTSLFIYTRTYTHTQSYSRINFHCHCWHTCLLHDLHLCLWTQRHRNPSVEHSRSVRLTFRRYFLFSFTLLSFCYSTEMAPCPSVLDKEMEKKTRQSGIDEFAKLFGRDFWCRFRFSRRENRRGWSDSVGFIELVIKKSSWFFSRAVTSHTPLVVSSFDYPNLLSLKECKCCDSGSKGWKLFVYMDLYGEICNSYVDLHALATCQRDRNLNLHG